MRKLVTAEHADDPRGMPERRDLTEELRLDVLARDEHELGLDPLCERGINEILALRSEETRLVAVLPPGEKLPDEPELLVLAGRDQAAFETSSSRAAFAASATTANAFGSDTAISASDLRSSSMPAFLTPDMKRL